MNVVPYVAGTHKDGILRLLGNGAYKRHVIDWQFARCTDKVPLVAVDTRNSVVGFNGVMPVTVYSRGRHIHAAWSCDFIVSPESRRQGVGKDIKKELDEQWPLIMALGISAVGQRALRRAGWTELAGPQRFVLSRPTSSPPVAGKGYAGIVLEKAVTDVWQSHELVLTFTRAANFSNESAVNELLENHLHEYETCILRDFEYLHWRYGGAPDGTYSILELANRDGDLCALAVLQDLGDTVAIVDYIGPRYSVDIKRAIVDTTIHLSAGKKQIECTTNDGEFHSCLKKYGFVAPRWSQTAFFQRDNRIDESPCPDDWFLMGGDSDGRILAGARFRWARLSIAHRGDADGFPSNETWSELQSRAAGDPLFLGWQWQTNWWLHFAQANELKLDIIEMRSQENLLVAVFPFFRRSTRVFGLPTNRLEMIGNIWQGPATMRSEYIKPITDPEWSAVACDELATILAKDQSYDELVLADFPVDDLDGAAILSALTQLGYVRNIERNARDETRFIVLPGSFSEYLAELSRSTRLRLFGRRKHLGKMGDVQYRIADIGEHDQFFEQLNRFHCKRWGKPAFGEQSLLFHKSLVEKLSRSQQVRSSILTVSGKVVSVGYNLVAGRRVYNLQLGFDESFGKGKLSLGMLHLGYDIEAAIRDGYEEFDLLAGAGKSTLYKNSITNAGTQLGTAHIIHSRWRRELYRVRDEILRRYRRIAGNTRS